MSAFIETTIHERDALVNVDAIEMIMPDSEGEHSIIRFRRPFEQTQEDGTMVCDGLQYNEDEALEPYDSLKAKILAATVKEEKENLPPTPPIREKGEGSEHNPARAHVREGSLACEGFPVPTLDEVKRHAATLGINDETATDFWYLFDGLGWKTKNGCLVSNWRSMLMSFSRGRKRLETNDAKRTAHIDAKMDERERMRERRAGGGRRKADNNVEMSDEVREEVRRDFTF